MYFKPRLVGVSAASLLFSIKTVAIHPLLCLRVCVRFTPQHADLFTGLLYGSNDWQSIIVFDILSTCSLVSSQNRKSVSFPSPMSRQSFPTFQLQCHFSYSLCHYQLHVLPFRMRMVTSLFPQYRKSSQSFQSLPSQTQIICHFLKSL